VESGQGLDEQITFVEERGKKDLKICSEVDSYFALNIKDHHKRNSFQNKGKLIIEGVIFKQVTPSEFMVSVLK
jgi:hypothetical protein